jgi:hypothetical protein
MPQDLVKNTSKEHPEYNKLYYALEKMRKIANFLNEEKRKQENERRLIQLRSSLSMSTELQELFKSGRILVFEGNLVIYNQQKQKPSEYGTFFLFHDMLVYSKKEWTKYRLKECMDLSDSQFGITNIQDDGRILSSLKFFFDLLLVIFDQVIQHAFKIESSTIEMVVCCDSKALKYQWLYHLKETVTAQRNKKLEEEEEMKRVAR